MIVTADEFCDDMDKYLDMVDNGEIVIIDYDGRLYRIESYKEDPENKGQ